jgi:tripartite-type tricarboxylate transporter receptor subunit TctC
MTLASDRRAFLHLAAGSVASAAAPRRASALDYPARPVHVIVGLAAGGPTDLVARLVAQWLSEHMGNQFGVENRTGAGGTLATETVINARADGYTLLFAGPTVTISASLYKKLSNVLDELTPVGIVMRVPNLMVVTPSLPVRTVKEFIDYAKANPGKLSMASSGVGASPHLSGEYFKFMTKIDMVHVPYRGSAAAYPDLISGKVHVLFDNLGGPVLEMVRAERLRALGVTSAERWPLLPGVPAIAETVPGYDVNVWYAMFAPRNTPPEIVTLLNTALKNAVAEPKIIARFREDGGVPTTMSPDALAKFLAEDEANWRKMVEAAGISAE